MKKTISILTIAAALMLGTFTLSSAFAVQQGDVISFKGKTNNVLVDSASEYPQKAKAEVGLQLRVDSFDESAYSGVGRMALEISFKDQQTTPPIVINADDNDFDYTYDDVGNILTIHEFIVIEDLDDEESPRYTISGTGTYDLDHKDRDRANINLEFLNDGLEDQERIIIKVRGEVILSPIDS